MKAGLALPLALLALAACNSSPKPIAGDPAIEQVAGTELPPPSRADMFTDQRPYLIGPYDKLVIDVFGIPELSQRTVQVDAGGNLSYPLAGTVAATGRTPNELASELSNRLRQAYVRNPQVTVNLESTTSQVVTVDGQVTKPGLYPVVGTMTLMRAVATAGGASEFAKLDDVVVFRTVGGQKYAALYNLKAIRRGDYPDPEIFANDVVVVGDSQARRLFRDILAAAPIITAPLIVLLR